MRIPFSVDNHVSQSVFSSLRWFVDRRYPADAFFRVSSLPGDGSDPLHCRWPHLCAASVAGGATFLYSSPISVNTTGTIKAVAIVSGFFARSVSSAAYTISSGGTGSINFGNGFAAGGMIFSATSALNGSRVRLTDGGTFDAASAWYGSQVSVSSFTNNFNFQLVPGANTLADGFCFVIQANNPTALGPRVAV